MNTPAAAPGALVPLFPRLSKIPWYESGPCVEMNESNVVELDTEVAATSCSPRRAPAAARKVDRIITYGTTLKERKKMKVLRLQKKSISPPMRSVYTCSWVAYLACQATGASYRVMRSPALGQSPIFPRLMFLQHGELLLWVGLPTLRQIRRYLALQALSAKLS